jgi:hypothetical protein
MNSVPCHFRKFLSRAVTGWVEGIFVVPGNPLWALSRVPRHGAERPS